MLLDGTPGSSGDDVIVMILYVVLVGGLLVVLLASVGALREAVRQRARWQGILLALGLALGSLLGIWAVLI